jgi:hypothetical protein
VKTVTTETVYTVVIERRIREVELLQSVKVSEKNEQHFEL